MGAGLPSALAAQIVFPERRVMAICGDGGFLMNSAEMETAVRLKLNLIVLILRDNAYGMIKWKQSNMDFPNWGLDFGNPDFVKYVESYGPMVTEWPVPRDWLLIGTMLSGGGVHVVEAPVDYSENDRILNHEIKELSAKL